MSLVTHRASAALQRALCALVLAALIVLLALPAQAREVPALRGHVNDEAALLSEADRQGLERRLSDYEASSGHQFAVLIIDSLSGDALEDFSIRTVEQWKLGKKGKDDGLLLLIVKSDHKLRIETGYGLEGEIPDALSSRVIREILTPAFRSGDYAGGIDRSLTRLMQAVGGAVAAERGSRERATRPNAPHFILFLLFAGFPLFFWFLNARTRRRGYGGGGMYWGGGGFNSGGGGFGGGGGGFGGGGGGFGGGGGSFGGGGASGSW